ncbi:MAG TPA: hypothetical protein VGI39_05065 [Polyangiaceae bacterium]|jgi:hypothetical protein
MSLPTRTATALLAFLLAACASPPPAQTASGDPGGQVSCADRARAQAVCVPALRQQCERQQSDCEIACERGDMHPTKQSGDDETHMVEATQCRDRCRESAGSCFASVARQCPQICATEAESTPAPAALPAP